MINKEVMKYFIAFEQCSESETKSLVLNALNTFDFTFPADYLEVIGIFNGQAGEVGEDGWLLLFPIEELLSINQDYSLLMEDIPDYFLFGKDAADTGYAFHKTNHTYHGFGLMSNFETDPFDFSVATFLEFIKQL
jgi:hypothetical protein